jgi:hypothetical protein
MPSSSEDEAVAARRRLIARSLEATSHGAPIPTEDPSSGTSSDVSSSSEESESGMRLRPIFVSKHQRASAKPDSSSDEDSKEAEFVEFKERLREQALKDALIEEEPSLSSYQSGEVQPRAPPIGMEDTEENYQKWKLRELKRILKFTTRQSESEDDEHVDENPSGKEKHKGVFFR